MTPATEAVPAASTGLARRTALNAAYSALGQVAGKLGTFAWTVVAARRLGPSGFGVFSVSLATALILSALAEWGFDQALVQRSSRDPANRNRYLVEGMIWEGGVGSCLFGVGGFVTAQFLHGRDATLALALVLGSIYLDSFSDTLRAAAAASQRQGATATALVAQRTVAAGLAVGLLAAGAGLVGLAAALAASSVLGLAGHLIALHRIGIRLPASRPHRRELRDFVRGTWIIGISGLVLAALFRLDALMLAGFKGTHAVGAYAAAYKLFDTSLFIAFALNGALFPVMAAVANHPQEVRRIFEGGVTVLAAGYCGFAALCLVSAHPVLRELYGGSYVRPSSTPLRWLALSPLPYGLAFLASSALTALRRMKGMLVAAVVATAVNVSCNLFAIPLFGGTGAAFLTTASYTVQAAVTLGYLRKELGLPLRLPEIVAVPAVAGAVTALWLGLAPLPTVGTVILAGPLYLALWFAGMRRFRPADVQILRQLVRRGGLPAAGR